MATRSTAGDTGSSARERVRLRWGLGSAFPSSGSGPFDAGGVRGSVRDDGGDKLSPVRFGVRSTLSGVGDSVKRGKGVSFGSVRKDSERISCGGGLATELNLLPPTRGMGK